MSLEQESLAKFQFKFQDKKSKEKVKGEINMNMHITIQAVRECFEEQPIELIPKMLDLFANDKRQGVQKICGIYSRKHQKFINHAQRVQNMRDFDDVFGNDGEHMVVGIDEAGRGPLAGPVVAAAVILPPGLKIEGIDDSKKLTAIKREFLYEEIVEKAIGVKVGIVEAQVIDEINILQATFRAMKKALFSLEQSPDIVLVDGNQIIPEVSEKITQHAVIKGDTKSLSIAAASIIAKVTRDNIMVEYGKRYPNYGFQSNKGYGCPDHQDVLLHSGPCAIHRKSFLMDFHK